MAKVLVVEDREDNMGLFTTILSLDNHEVIQAYNGKQGLEALTKHRDIGIILSDYDMPEMNGFEFTKQVRTNPQHVAYSNIPIIGVGDFPEQKKEYLTLERQKPVTPIDLLEDIKKLCR
jgi:CheY-like chemotaxis protein